MTSGSQRTTFHRSGLVRLLSASVPDAHPKYDLGERLGQWLDFTDALTLYSALNSGTGAAAAGRAEDNPDIEPVRRQFVRVRRSLSAAIVNDGVFTGETARIRFPLPLPQASAASAADFSPYHRYYLAHQRDMSAAIGALRTEARQALGKGSPSGRQLAELDLAFEEALAARERKLLAAIPLLLAQRFARRYEEHRGALADASADDPARWAAPGSWLEAFCRETQAILLAELELRLKPVAGLIAALGGRDGETQINEQ